MPQPSNSIQPLSLHLRQPLPSQKGQLTETSPLGLRLTKECLAASVDAGSLEQAIYMEDRNQTLCVNAGYVEEGARAFIEKRKPRFAEDA